MFGIRLFMLAFATTKLKLNLQHTKKQTFNGSELFNCVTCMQDCGLLWHYTTSDLYPY